MQKKPRRTCLVVDLYRRPLSPIPMYRAKRMVKRGRATLWHSNPMTIMIKKNIPDPQGETKSIEEALAERQQ